MKISIYNVQDTPIGGGGMGEVYLGWDGNGNAVAIKKMRAELTVDTGLRSFFHREVNTLKQLEHQNIVKMYASFEERGNLYLVMEYVEGETIEQYVRRKGAIVESEAIRLLCEILSAIAYLHQKGFIHRDIKPSNIMIRSNGRVCVLDFGIVKDMKNSSGYTVNQIIGTDGYMSPEQAEAMSIDQRSDIYSLGCVLYYMSVGDHAIKKQSSDFDTRMTIIKKTFPRAKDYNPDLSDHIQRILDKATEKNMLCRFQSCREFEMELRGGVTVVTDVDTYMTVSVGREECDIVVSHPKVSRHHADIEVVINSDGHIYKFRDRSTNGTIVNNVKIQNQEKKIFMQDRRSVNVQPPSILLAGEVELKWEEVEAAFAKKLVVKKPPVAPPTQPVFKPQPKHDLSPVQEEGKNATGWLIAIYFFAILGGLLGLFFGLIVYRQKVDMPNGEKVYKYKDSHRKAALGGAILSCISMIIWKIATTV